MLSDHENIDFKRVLSNLLLKNRTFKKLSLVTGISVDSLLEIERNPHDPGVSRAIALLDAHSDLCPTKHHDILFED